MKEKKGIFDLWLKNFALTVFMQSFHAVFFMFILKIIAGIYTNAGGSNNAKAFTNTAGILSIITIVSIMMLTKMEKFFKETFGVSSAKFMGGISESAAKGFGGIASAVNMAKRTAEPFKRKAAIGREMGANNAKIDKLEGRLGYNKGPSSKELSSYEKAKIEKKSGNMDGYHEYMNKAADEKRKEKENKTLSQEKQNNSTNVNVKDGGPSNNSDNQLPASQRWKMEDDLEELYAKQTALETESKGANLNALTRMGSTVASLGFGAGAAEDLSGAMTVSNLVDMPLDKIGDIATKRHANAQMYAINKSNAYEAKQSGDERRADNYEKSAKGNKMALDNQTIKELKNIWKDGTKDLASNPIKSAKYVSNPSNGDKVKYNNTIVNVISPKSQMKKVDKLYSQSNVESVD